MTKRVIHAWKLHWRYGLLSCPYQYTSITKLSTYHGPKYTKNPSDVTCKWCKKHLTKKLLTPKQEKTYTLAEIKEYLQGWLLHNLNNTINVENESLHNSISQIECPEDGIEAVTKRVEEYKKISEERNKKYIDAYNKVMKENG